MTAHFDGAKLVDNAGDAVGTIQRTYLDESGAVQYLEVKMGTILSKSRLVPGDALQETDGAVRVPYSREAIEESPSIRSGDTLEGEALQSVESYYAEGGGANAMIDSSPRNEGMASDETRQTDSEGNRFETNPHMISTVGEIDERNRPASDYGEIPQEAPPPHFGEVRDLGDVIEVPIVEEVLVKKPVVREVLRIRKSQVTEEGIAGADIRKESVQVISTAGDDVHDATGELQEEKQ